MTKILLYLVLINAPTVMSNIRKIQVAIRTPPPPHPPHNKNKNQKPKKRTMHTRYMYNQAKTIISVFDVRCFMKNRTQTYARADVKHRNLLSWPYLKKTNQHDHEFIWIFFFFFNNKTFHETTILSFFQKFIEPGIILHTAEMALRLACSHR